jgi:DNA-binding transcriptional LysR family regulator
MDGRAFLPHARDLPQAAERAAASVRPGRRALRVDVIGRHLAPAGLLRDFHRANPETELDVVTLFDADAAIAAKTPHPALAALRGYLSSRPPGYGDAGIWTPRWAENLLPRPGLPSL